MIECVFLALQQGANGVWGRNGISHRLSPRFGRRLIQTTCL